MLVFLGLNGFDFTTHQDRIADMFERLAAGDASQDEFFAWVRDNATLKRSET
jgi:prophage maintenance system killer protein